MDFVVEFYETATGSCPVREFLDELKASDPDDFAAVVAGLAKLRNRQYHREPLSKALGDGLFELRHVGKLNTRIIWFFIRTGESWHCTGFVTRVSRSLLVTSIPRVNECVTGGRE
jgi:hypothetical protein